MITDIYDIKSLHKVYDYLSTTNAINDEEAHSFYGSIINIRKGNLPTAEKERELQKFFALYNGMTAA